MYLGVKAVIAKSMARIHKNNLINHGVLPLVFENKNDYDGLEQGDLLEINNCHEEIRNRKVIVYNKTKGTSFTSLVDLSDDEVEIILSGGQLRFIKNQMVTA